MLFKIKPFLLFIILSTSLLFQGCAGIVIGGAAAGASAVHDRRTFGSVIEDQAIELKAMKAYYSNEHLRSQTHINMTSYNGVILLTGEAPTEALRAEADHSFRGIEKVKRVHNEIIIAAPSSLLARNNDALLTAKAKLSLTKVKGYPGFDLTRVKIITENGTCFLMGLLTKDEAEAVTQTVRQVKGIQMVVRIFEYV